MTAVIIESSTILSKARTPTTTANVMGVYDDVRALLTSSEVVQVVLEALFVPSADDSSLSFNAHANKSPNVNALPDDDPTNPNRRILAVVSHRDDWDLSEEGCIFVCKYKSTPTPTSPSLPASSASTTLLNGELEIQRIYPIYGSFALAMGQMRRGPSSDVPLTPGPVPGSPAGALEKGPTRSGFSLTIIPADSPPSSESTNESHSTFFTPDIPTLKLLIAECKRLREVSEVDDATGASVATHQFAWLGMYLSSRAKVSLLSSTPPDLRLSTLPLLYRLSPASAGQPGDDTADIEVVREGWVRARAREHPNPSSRSSNGYGGRGRLKVRIGTFNVNDKLPSQDLSAWIQGLHNDATLNSGGNKEGERGDKGGGAPTIPPLARTSPLTLKGFEWGRTKSNSSIHSSTATPAPEPEPVRFTQPSSSSQNTASATTTVASLSSQTTLPTSDPRDEPESPANDEPDLLILGFQELDLSTEALLYSTRTTREDAWCLAVVAALGEKGGGWVKLASKQLVGMLILVFVKKELKDCFGDVKTTAAGAGLLGVMGNKGAVAIRLTFTPPASFLLPPDNQTTTTSTRRPGPTTLTFVNAHLAAFDEMVDKRNLDYQELCRKLSFEIEPGSTLTATRPGEVVREAVGVFESDVLFWIVDLNYRLDLPDIDVRRVLGTKDWEGKCEVLLRFDQLKKAIQSKKAFDGFQEGPISHLPSYRFSPGLAMDKLGYDIKRKPAWTDRILYMFNPACTTVTQTSYSSHPQITMSDHRPVAADYDIDVDIYDKDQRDETIRKLFRQVDHMENSHERPSIKLEDAFVDFGNVCYETPVTRTLNVRNTGRTPCAYRFVPIQADAPIHPEWLKIEPLAGLLLPDEVVEIKMSVYVDNALASIMNLQPKDLGGTLILHTVMGKDHFISVSGEYQYTCFANRLTTLTRLPGPIRSLKSPSEIKAENHAINAPREVMRVVNWMMTHSTQNELFLSPPDEEIVDTIRECLDTGDEFPYPHDTQDCKIPIAFSVTLLRLLNSLVEPVVPPLLHARCMQMTSQDEAFELLDALPAAAVNVWISVTAFLHFICQSSKDTEHVEKIASVFAPVLLRDDPLSTVLPVSPAGKRKFLLYFIS
ncbi:Endonuclease/exonuclease/phosphatase [Crucibulum laeve]|uniref:Endonuclease/exonuclease/phosphatase n=1 Tax=Crucibulum laeve TaxID=68775 RepID=A0A5C3LHM7_9AGAR|nr:Endonuclease/exonuclease/phosphatase [Crucibulum laeve]